MYVIWCAAISYLQGLLPVEVTKPSHGLTATLQNFFSRVNQHGRTISPQNLLSAIGRKLVYIYVCTCYVGTYVYTVCMCDMYVYVQYVKQICL